MRIYRRLNPLIVVSFLLTRVLRENPHLPIPSWNFQLQRRLYGYRYARTLQPLIVNGSESQGARNKYGI